MTSEQLAKIQRDYLIRTEKQSAVLLAAKFQIFKSELAKFLRTNSGKIKARELVFIKLFLEKFESFFDNLVLPFERIVSLSQTKVIALAGESLKTFFPEIKTSIFRTDTEAVKKLIGRTQSGTSLSKFFARLKPEISELAKKELLEGFAVGDSVKEIAVRINKVSGVGLSRAMTISRSETVSAYRRASVEFYDNAGIVEYRFLSVLDIRTCPICWSLHGRKFKLKVKPNIHVNCRCVIVPVVSDDEKIETGIERFNKLSSGFQKQILGNKRFELFQNGQSLKSFVKFEKSKEYGRVYKIRNLSEFEN